MPGNRKPKGKLIPIGTLAGMSGVSVQTIHYYIGQGLLKPPVKTSRNMAYYDPQCIEEIRYIKELQSKRFLPLSMIKLMVQAKRRGQGTEHLVDMRSLLEDLFHPLETETEPVPKELSFHELASDGGLSEADLKTLETMGLIMPSVTDHGQLYDDIDLHIARIIKKLTGLGLTFNDLNIYSQYVEVIQNEAQAIHDKIHRLPDAEIFTLTELVKTLNMLKTYLGIKVCRETLLRAHK
jgi:DNA-binding transcriptional MerR regulator